MYHRSRSGSRLALLAAAAALLLVVACDLAPIEEDDRDCAPWSGTWFESCPIYAVGAIYPAWSPDGTQVLYIRGTEAGTAGLFRFVLIDERDELITEIGPADLSPQAWSPDGEWIVLSSGAAIWKLRPDGSDATILAFDPEREYFEAAWSPDGEWIAFLDRTPVPHDQVGLPDSVLQRGNWIMRPDGSEQHWTGIRGAKPVWDPTSQILLTHQSILPHFNYRLLQNYAFEDLPRDTINPGDNQVLHRHDYSPDGTQIVFDAQQAVGQDYNVWKINVDGTGKTRLTETGGAHPAWSPDGQTIAYVNIFWREATIWLMDADGSNKRRMGLPPMHP